MKIHVFAINAWTWLCIPSQNSYKAAHFIGISFPLKIMPLHTATNTGSLSVLCLQCKERKEMPTNTYCKFSLLSNLVRFLMLHQYLLLLLKFQFQTFLDEYFLSHFIAYEEFYYLNEFNRIELYLPITSSSM